MPDPYALNLLNFIAGPESGGRYDVAYGGAQIPPGLTVGQMLEWQKRHGQRTGSSAAGKYQFLEGTLRDLVTQNDVPMDAQFTPQLQDHLATKLLDRRGLEDYRAGKITPEQFSANLSKEWAGLPKDSSGASYYAGDSMGNKAGVEWADLMNAVTGGTVPMAAVAAGPAYQGQDIQPVTGSAPVTVQGAEPGGFATMDPRLMQMYEQQIAAQNDPWAMLGRMGAGILSGGGGPGAGNWFGRGAAAAMAPQQGAAQMGPLQMLQAETQLMKLEDARRARQLESRERTQTEKSMAELEKDYPELARLKRAGVTPPASVVEEAMGIEGAGVQPTVGTTPRFFPNQDGTYTEVRYDSAGNRITETVDKLPINVDVKTADTRQRIAEQQEYGKAVGKEQAARELELPQVQVSADSLVGTIDKMLSNDEGMSKAVGVRSAIPTIPGTAAADYEADYNKVKGETFLQAFQQLKGAGQITEIEGQKAEQAISSLALTQSPAAHRQALQDLRDVTMSGLERAKKAAGVDDEAPATPARRRVFDPVSGGFSDAGN